MFYWSVWLWVYSITLYFYRPLDFERLSHHGGKNIIPILPPWSHWSSKRTSITKNGAPIAQMRTSVQRVPFKQQIWCYKICVGWRIEKRLAGWRVGNCPEKSCWRTLKCLTIGNIASLKKWSGNQKHYSNFLNFIFTP